MIINEIKEKVHSGDIIPKPDAKADFIIKGWGKRRGENAFIYFIPNHNNSEKPYQKGITESEFEKAYNQLICQGEFSRIWFNQEMKDCASEGGCNFTTIGGIFILLNVAFYERGKYLKLQ